MPRPDAIETYSGLYVRPLALRPEDVRLADVAHALSNTCRFTGHSRVFYSVAEHSVLVSRRMLRAQAFGLLHDASEAYLTDVARPVKRQLSGYAEAEANAQRAIYMALVGFLPSPQEEVLVEQADNDLLVTEGEALMPSKGKDWTVEGTPLVPCPQLGCRPETAEHLFLQRAEELGVRDGR